MAQAPLKRCAKPGCRELVRGQPRCDKCKGDYSKQHDKHRPNATERGYNHQWRTARKAFLLTHPICAECDKNGRVEAASVVDHIEPHRGDFQKFWDRANWQPLCKRCHDQKTRRGE